jgi:uncharacterized caspase-like protein/peptidoglycan hydrolase-like protein with peptidoglycan-binding domain
MKRLFQPAILFAAFLMLCFQTAQANTNKRVAFVIGNSAYQNAVPLANPRNDAVAMSKKLRELDFVTVEGLDLTAIEFRAKIREFAQLAADADLAIFFYAGHGLAVDGTNYMVPVDAKFEDITALDFEAVSVDFITRQMGYSGGVNLLFLDACRNNPLATNLSRAMGKLSRSTSVSTGLAEMKIENPGKGLAIAFATSPGEVALDGTGSHSPFTAALLKHISAENTDITEVMSRVTGEVYSSTNETQRPWMNSSLTGSVVLNAVAVEPRTSQKTNTAAPSAGTGNADMLEVERTVFQMARDSDSIEDYNAYLDTFPDGVFVNFARRSIERLEKAENEPDTQVAAQQDSTRTLNPDEPATQAIQLTPDQKAMPSNTATEQFLTVDRAKRREVQARLNLSGNNVGRPDGSFGPKTRGGIQSWQVSNGLAPSGYLNHPQYLYLVSTTQEMYVIWVAENPTPVRKARRTTTQQPSTQSTNSNNSNSNGGISPGLGAFLGGVATGFIIGN